MIWECLTDLDVSIPQTEIHAEFGGAKLPRAPRIELETCEGSGKRAKRGSRARVPENNA